MITCRLPGTNKDSGYRFVWGGTCFLMFLWAFFRLPETWNRSYQELDILFAKRIPARKFASTEVDLFEDQEIGLDFREAPADLG
jgi:hypothetical protein